jgi:hypothetical protein
VIGYLISDRVISLCLQIRDECRLLKENEHLVDSVGRNGYGTKANNRHVEYVGV